jgi:hypothetical protein
MCNLPPGCGVGSIPGNTSNDIRWENKCEKISRILGCIISDTAFEELVQYIIDQEDSSYDAGYQQSEQEWKRQVRSWTEALKERL